MFMAVSLYSCSKIHYLRFSYESVDLLVCPLSGAMYVAAKLHWIGVAVFPLSGVMFVAATLLEDRF